ncbi:MAG: diguanylate cyclase [Sphingomonadales bacterium]|nr:diguanylate cyclase [Sphingomonadales bacterium]MBD3773101.1 diguanylate cyclase [Paracoccaceae bacterium]
MGRIWYAWLVLAVLALSCAPAGARAANAPAPATAGAASAPFCFVGTKPSVSAAAALSAPLDWDCSNHRPGIEAKRTQLRFEIAPDSDQPRYFTSRRTAMKGIEIATRDAAGVVRTAYYREEELIPAHLDATFLAPLPRGEAPLREAVVAVDLPTQAILLTRAQLAQGDPGDSPEGRARLLFLAALCGMMVMPIFFSVAFYRVLRKDFVLWHAALIVSLLAQMLVNSGLLIDLISLRADTMSALMILAFGASMGAGSMFARSYLEPDKLHPALRQALLVIAIASFAASTVHGLFPHVLRTVQADIYYAIHTPVLVVMLVVAWDSLRRGSRAAKFMVAGWVPLFMVGAIRIIGQVTPFMAPTDAMGLFQFAMVFDVFATALGVADRFLIIRRQRDRARNEAYIAEQLAGHDSLTGLLNRRAVEGRFGQLQRDGFHTLAVLDLDRFKDINDRFGHQLGDSVLVACARALDLAEDRDSVAVRLGGEEFMVLLRGSDTQHRVEAFRRAIPLRIARDVPALDRPVTASMGVVAMPPEGLEGMDFAELYARADQLLYEAKASGRNRAMWEKLVVFGAGRSLPVRASAAA